MRRESGRVFGLDLMRAIAILLVLVSHGASIFPHNSLSRYTFSAGYLGVDLFFVLSGFLIGGILFRTLTKGGDQCTLRNFWLRRWLRTLPNYYLFLGVNLLVAFWLHDQTATTICKFIFFLQNLLRLPPRFFGESWSLTVEEWFYLLTPVLFFAAHKIAPKKFFISTLLIIFAVIATVTTMRCQAIAHSAPVMDFWLRMTAKYRFDACMFGVFAAWLKHFYPQWFCFGRRTNFVIGVLLLVFAYLPAVRESSVLLRCAVFSMNSLGGVMILPLLDNFRTIGRAGTPIVKISLWSYSLYLVHQPVRRLLHDYMTDVPPIIQMICFLFLSVLIAEFVFSFYERPIMTFRDRRSRAREKFPDEKSCWPNIETSNSRTSPVEQSVG